MADEQPVTHTYHVAVEGRGIIEVHATKVEDRGGWMTFDDDAGSVFTAQAARIISIERCDAAKWAGPNT